MLPEDIPTIPRMDIWPEQNHSRLMLLNGRECSNDHSKSNQPPRPSGLDGSEPDRVVVLFALCKEKGSELQGLRV